MQACLGRADRKQILLLGPSGAGKTTLLYRLRLPEWKEAEIQRDLFNTKLKPAAETDDACPNYEEFQSVLGVKLRCGIWDPSGVTEMQALWPSYFKLLRMDAVVVVVSAPRMKAGYTADELQTLETMRPWLRRLIAEDQLRHAYIAVVVNCRDSAVVEDETLEGGVKVSWDGEKGTLKQQHRIGDQDVLVYTEEPLRERHHIDRAREHVKEMKRLFEDVVEQALQVNALRALGGRERLGMYWTDCLHVTGNRSSVSGPELAKLFQTILEFSQAR